MTRHPMTVLLPFDTPFYAPLPAGVALGHFADEGLDVKAMPAAAFGKGTIQAARWRHRDQPGRTHAELRSRRA